MSKSLEFAIDEYYHIYNRGTDKRSIFLTDSDRDRFQLLLYLANNTAPVRLADELRSPRGVTSRRREMFALRRPAALVDIGVYCLMPNHFHLLVREKVDNGITQFMRKLLTGYSMYFNIRHHRTGRLFEGSFRATHVANDNYLKYLFAYIHLNPIKITDPMNWERKIIPRPAKTLKFLEQYRYSSFPDYLGQRRPEDAIINRADFPDYFVTATDFRHFIKEWSEYQED